MISIICIHNDQEVLEKNLLRTLREQSFKDYELILVDTTQLAFNSAAEALNYGGEKAKGEIIVFVHQDIQLTSKFFLEELAKHSKEYDFGIAGVAGVGVNFESFSRIVHGSHKEYSAKNYEFTEPINALSLDECLLIIPKNMFEKNKFSNLGNTWHLYGTDYSLKMLSLGNRVLILPISLWHLSEGKSLNLNYFDTIRNVANLYSSFDNIYTLFGKWPTNRFLLYLKTFYRKTRYQILGR
ncbi:TPA: glycosyltransferase family 2 protein [Streptococcus suis]